MAEKMIKVLLFTWFHNEPSAINPAETARLEKLARLGEVVDIDDDYSLQRGEELGAFFTDEERKEIEEETYAGEDAPAVYAALGVTAPPVGLIEPAGGEGPMALSVEALAEYITENNLNSEQTIALAGDDADSINKVLDAENIATDNEPRKSVVSALEKKLAAAQ
jgi:hypothetical protein